MKKINKICFIISFLFSTLFINFNVNAFGMFDYNNYQGQTTGYTFEEDRENYHDDEGKDNERNEDDKYIRFAKIGEVQSAVSYPLKVFYLGIDINWLVRRMGENYGNGNNSVMTNDFFRLFQNLNVYLGWRFYKYLALEAGYIRYNNTNNLLDRRIFMNGAYLDLIAYTPFIDLKYTTLEFYASAGGLFLASEGNATASRFGGKFGAGIQAKVYGSFVIRVGVDYLYPVEKIFADKGILTFKTGFQLYFNFNN